MFPSLPCHPEAATEERPGDPGQPDRPHAGLLPQELCQPLCRQPGRWTTDHAPKYKKLCLTILCDVGAALPRGLTHVPQKAVQSFTSLRSPIQDALDPKTECC